MTGACGGLLWCLMLTLRDDVHVFSTALIACDFRLLGVAGGGRRSCRDWQSGLGCHAIDSDMPV
jgi:D-serine dehydratase